MPQAGPSYEDVYSIGRVLLADQSEHQSAKKVPARRRLIEIPLLPDHLPPHFLLYHSDQEPKKVEPHFEQKVPAESSSTSLDDTVCELNANKAARLSEQMHIISPVIHTLKQ
jgi:hypothetical protein